jgi:hypothetical protein
MLAGGWMALNGGKVDEQSFVEENDREREERSRQDGSTPGAD